MLAGNISALLGVLLCIVAGLARVAGFHVASGFATMTLFQVGTALLVLACLCKLQSLLVRSR